MKNIGLIGVSRSGKDTIGRFLVETYGYRRVAFADAVRRSLLAMDPYVRPVEVTDAGAAGTVSRGVDVERLSAVVGRIGWERAKDEVPEVRRLLQAYASEGVRDVLGADTWLNIGLRAADEANADGVPVVFTDVRFRNEVDALRERGAFLVYILRPGAAPANGHRSERELSPADADAVIRNDGDLLSLYYRTCRLAESL